MSHLIVADTMSALRSSFANASRSFCEVLLEFTI